MINMIDIGEYLKRTNSNQQTQSGNYTPSDSGYVFNQKQNNNSFGQVPSEFYRNDGSVDYNRLEKWMGSRNGVNTQMTGWNPVDGQVYALEGNSDTYNWDHPILYAKPFSEGITKVQTSSSVLTNNEIDNLLFHSIRPEYQDMFAEMLSRTQGYST